ncbi:MAG TPA: 16S rRNA (guanine(527)-N(7))-methyltransferase RsmG, partial [Caulobacteraceae bacterium]|nr:16S rRNA (guanine(527)-N(7))-methyltransferase RsmG [Caulobacteraceae bacterium]
MSGVPALREAISDAGVDVVDAASFMSRVGATPAQMADLQHLQAMLGDWNQRMNLVSPASLAEFWPRHAFDSAQLLQASPNARIWADIGAGAGFPGLVLAILLKHDPGARVHLVESIAKKCGFLSAVVTGLNLPAEVHNVRAERLALKADVVTARAVAPLCKLLGFAQPYFARGAVGLVLKGPGVEAEVAEA